MAVTGVFDDELPRARAARLGGRSSRLGFAACRFGRACPWRVAAAIAVTVTLGGCERERWVDGGPALPYCLWEREARTMDAARREASKKGMDQLAAHACGYHKLTYAGEIRCRDGASEVRCR